MAQFNPELPGQVQNFTQDSKGAKSVPVRPGAPSVEGDYSGAYKAKGQAATLENYAKIGDAVIGTTDYIMNKYIEDQLKGQTDEIRDKFGVGAAAKQQMDISLAPEPGPKELEDASRTLTGLQAARSSGRLTESHYYGRLESMVRQMKTRFPGYSDDIDTMVSKITGVTPANALRSALASEAQSDGEKMSLHTKLLKESGGAIQRQLTDVFEREKAGNPYSDIELIQAKSATEAGDADLAHRQAKVSYAASAGTLNAKDAEDGLAHQIQASVVTPLLNGIYTNQTGTSDAAVFHQKLMEMEKKTGPLSGDDIIAIDQQATVLKGQVTDEINRIIRDPFPGQPGTSWYSIIHDDAKLKSITDSALGQIDDWVERVKNEHHGLEAHNAALVSTHMDAASAKIVNSDDVAAVPAMIKVYGAETVNTAMMAPGDEGTKLLNNVQRTLNNAIIARVATGDSVSVSDELRGVAARPGVKIDKNFVQTTVRRTTDLLANADNTIENRKKVAHELFGPQNDSIFALVPEQDQLLVYKTMTSDAVHKSMEAIKDAGGQKEWDDYRRWTTEKFKALFKGDIDSLQKITTNSDYYTVDFDDSTMKWKVNPLPIPSGTPLKTEMALSDKTWVNFRRDAVTRVNEEFSRVTKIFESDQDDPLGYLKNEVFPALGINPHAVKEGSLYGKMLRALERPGGPDTLGGKPINPKARSDNNLGGGAGNDTLGGEGTRPFPLPRF